MNGFEKNGIWPLNPEVFQESGFVPSTLKHCIVNDDGNIEKPHERIEHRPISSTRGSTSEHQERTASKDQLKKLVLRHPKAGTQSNCRDISSFKVRQPSTKMEENNRICRSSDLLFLQKCS
jgi:hypothetical protein